MGNPKLRMMVDNGADVYGNLDKFCSGIFKDCFKCVSVAMYIWLHAEKKKAGRHVAV